jgi:hypothetical protein
MCSYCGCHDLTAVPFEYRYQVTIQPQQGWQCPVCSRVYAPHVRECEHCNRRICTGQIESTTGISDNADNPDIAVVAPTWDELTEEALIDHIEAWERLANS